jgi:DNA polymerase III delta prime subunit
MTENTLWVEKFRPDTLDGYIGNTQMKAKFASFIENGEVPHLLLVGPAGTGKTTAAKILVNSIPCDSMIINASDENNIDTVRTKIRSFASTRGWNPWKIMVLDEFDGFTQAGQGALRNLMELFSANTRFILTANYIERIIEPIISRTQQFRVSPPSQKEAAIHIAGILKQEGVTFALPDLKLLIDAHFPDIRKILNEAQLAVVDGTLKVDKAQIMDSDFKLKVVGALKAKKTVNDIRQILADSGMRDFTELYRVLFDDVLEFGSMNQIGELILAINEGQYRDSIVVDKEINMVATLIHILTVIK